MKQKKLLWIVVIAVAVCGYIAGTSIIKGKLEAHLSGFFGRAVKIRSVQGTFPPGFVAKEITVAENGEAKAVTVASAAVKFSFLSVFSGNPGCELDLYKPVIYGERDQQGQVRLSLTPEMKQQLVIPFVRLRVRDGEINFIDRKVSPEFPWVLRQAALSVKRGRTQGLYLYSLLGTVISPDDKPAGKLSATGAFSLKDKSADGKITIEHDALEYLVPYIQPILGTAPSRGAGMLMIQAASQNSELKADVAFTGAGIIFAMEQPTVLGPSGNRLAEMLQEKDGKVHLSFAVEGSTGPGFDWQGAISAKVQEAMRQAMSRSILKSLGDSEQGTVGEHVRKGIESLGR